jgi:DNA-binding MarR family transcriptional regulator
MYYNCLQFLDATQPLTIRELCRRARTRTRLRGLLRWGYIKIAAPVSSPQSRAKNKKPDGTWLVTATPAGQRAQKLWKNLLPAIEKRWRDHFGKTEITELRDALAAIVDELPKTLPDCLPILQYGLLTKVSPRVYNQAAHVSTPTRIAVDVLPLPALLSRVLLAFALDFERDSPLSLAISANLLRVLSPEPTALRELPLPTGISKEAISMALGILRQKHFVVIEPEKSKRGKTTHLTPQGCDAQRAYLQHIAHIEKDWQRRFGSIAIRALRTALEQLNLDRLFASLAPHPDNWRAQLPPPHTLPHFPVVLHRGAFPDGS